MGRIIYGGSFNPVHVAHLRVAVESSEMLADLARNFDFVPAANPPHKDARDLLPFGMRSELIRRAIEGLPHMACNELEAERHGATYTFDTLVRYHRDFPGEHLFFLIGSQDYALLPEWHKGLELPRLCSLVVAPRGNFSLDDFARVTRGMWNDCKHDPATLAMIRHAEGKSACMRPEGGMPIFCLPIPYLDISASMIRAYWLAGRSIDYLVPQGTLDYLDANRHKVQEHWEGGNRQC